jgi:hypothetical protein
MFGIFLEKSNFIETLKTVTKEISQNFSGISPIKITKVMLKARKKVEGFSVR